MDHMPTVRATLRDAIIEALFASGFLPNEAAAYVLALEELGALEVGKPEWIPRSILFRVSQGWRPSHDRFQTITNLVNRRVDKWLAEPHLSPIAGPEDVEAFRVSVNTLLELDASEDGSAETSS